MGEVNVYFNPIFKTANETKKRYRVMKGSAGSGKSMNVSQDYIIKLSSEMYRGCSLLCVRKVKEANANSTYSELKSAIRRIFGEQWAKHWNCKKQPLEMECLDTGNKILFEGVNDDEQVEKLKSITVDYGSICWIWVEEATELESSDLFILDTRLRGALSNPNLYYQITLTFNPVSADHWIKSEFFDTKNPLVFTHHSTYLDNEFCDAQFLESMERQKTIDPDGYRVYGLGEWGLTGGQFFSEWSEKKHTCDPFPIPEHWTRMRVMDWGSSKPYAVYWIAIDYDGKLWVYRELYGYGGRPNVGTKESSLEVAMKIAEIEKETDYKMIYQAILDNACWSKQDPAYPSIQETMNSYLSGQGCLSFTPSVKGRSQCAEQMKLRLHGDGKTSGICFFKNCHHAIRTIPMLTHDKYKPEAPDTNKEDHSYDAIAYGLMARPYVPSVEVNDYDNYNDYESNEAETTAWGA